MKDDISIVEHETFDWGDNFANSGIALEQTGATWLQDDIGAAEVRAITEPEPPQGPGVYIHATSGQVLSSRRSRRVGSLYPGVESYRLCQQSAIRTKWRCGVRFWGCRQRQARPSQGAVHLPLSFGYAEAVHHGIEVDDVS